MSIDNYVIAEMSTANMLAVSRMTAYERWINLIHLFYLCVLDETLNFLLIFIHPLFIAKRPASLIILGILVF